MVEIVDRPKPPYLLIDSRRLDAGNIFVPVKENSELTLACISEGGNPKPILSWEVLISPGVDRHSQKVSAEVLELQEIKNEVKISSFFIFFFTIDSHLSPFEWQFMILKITFKTKIKHDTLKMSTT